ncbi:DegV family protein [Slackia exigua]|uniref:DegV family protein n=1 Tax=Slackia exigua TaxID=84109 RepID=UPI00210DC48F|nr:DegV family protein [Slackia exigua]MCQ5090619.1 DegV family EDD domain-containing protein [Slackia exigua]
MPDFISKLNQSASQLARQAAALKTQAGDLAEAAFEAASRTESEREGGPGTDARYAYETPLPDIPVEASTASTIPRPTDGVATGAAPDARARTNSHGENIAFIVDSCCDVVPAYREKYPVFVVPMLINYREESFLDRETISPAEVFARFDEEIPKTSTPTPAYVHRAFEQVEAAGFTHVICVTISSGLSSTHAIFETVSLNFPHLTCEIIDTLNIGVGSGMTAMRAMELFEQDVAFADIARQARRVASQTHIFILPDTLEYLYKGGRIGKAVYSLGSALNLRPLITCTPNDGTYAVIGKARGRKKSIAKLVELAQKGVDAPRRYRVAMAEGIAREELDALLARAQEYFPDATEVIDAGSLSPALVVHTGPGLLGIVVQNLDEQPGL